jgi:hypothetical protein
MIVSLWAHPGVPELGGKSVTVGKGWEVSRYLAAFWLRYLAALSGCVIWLTNICELVGTPRHARIRWEVGCLALSGCVIWLRYPVALSGLPIDLDFPCLAQRTPRWP